ncbi:MAG: DUF2723 domain-containing protein [Chlorobiota bacterium]|nr:DUF2723 domain-containing protein [Chlorobiota bacterium]QQS65437.1 MAG: DUF2723 domain-containing protein [Chlorobiota bacterium]
MIKFNNFITIKSAAIISSIIAAVVYYITMNPTYGFIDHGELATVASTLGVAHPTGYPTLILLGFLFTKIIPFENVFSLNLLSVLLCSLSVFNLTFLFDYILKRSVNPSKFKLQKKKNLHKNSNRNKIDLALSLDTKSIDVSNQESTSKSISLISAFSALCVATSSLWWGQSNGFEAYPLHLFFMPLITLLFIKFVDLELLNSDQISIKKTTIQGNIFVLILGLSFTNHMMTILFAPAFIFYYFINLKINKKSFLRLIYLTPSFIIGLLPYLILPIIAFTRPRLNWGNVVSLKNFFSHFFANQYRVWMFQNSESFKSQSLDFFKLLPTEFGIIGMIVIIVGVKYWFTKNKPFLLFCLLILLSNLIYSGGYDIPDIMNYYVGSIFSLSILFVGGLKYLIEKFNVAIITSIALVIILLNVFCNFSSVNESNNFLVKDYTNNVLDNLPKNSILFSSQWDFFVSGSMYEQIVNKKREDVIIIDPELMRRSWYINQLDYNNPSLMIGIESIKSKFLEQVKLFESDMPYNPTEIQSAYVGLIDGIIKNNYDKKSILFSGAKDEGFAKGYNRVPYHLALLLTKDENYVPQNYVNYSFRKMIKETTGIDSYFQPKQNYYTLKLNEIYCRYITARMNYETNFNKQELIPKYKQLLEKFMINIDLNDLKNDSYKSQKLMTPIQEYFLDLENKLKR